MNANGLQIFAKSGLVPVRSEPTHTTALMTMLLHGEVAEILSIRENWIQIITSNEGWIGWVEKEAVEILPPDQFSPFPQDESVVRWPYFSMHLKVSKNQLFMPTGGIVCDRVDHFSLWNGCELPWPAADPLKQSTIIETARNFAGVPYLFGGRTDTGIDAGGFIQTLHLLHHLSLPRDYRQQVAVKAFTADNIQHAEPASLIYFSDENSEITHVGFCLGDGAVVHASGSVKIENIEFSKRFDSKYPFNQRLAETVAGIQSPVTEGDTIIPVGESALS